MKIARAGFTPIEALQTATLNPGQYLWLAATGTIEKRKRVDLVLLDAIPLDDIRNTRRIQRAIVAGCYLPRNHLDELLLKAEKAAARSK
jgi:imidazolonepropionase-like amidohydrolase